MIGHRRHLLNFFFLTFSRFPSNKSTNISLPYPGNPPLYPRTGGLRGWLAGFQNRPLDGGAGCHGWPLAVGAGCCDLPLDDAGGWTRARPRCTPRPH